MCFVWITEQTAIISLYSINLPIFITETECVYCAVRPGSLTQTDTFSFLKASHSLYASTRKTSTPTPDTRLRYYVNCHVTSKCRCLHPQAMFSVLEIASNVAEPRHVTYVHTFTYDIRCSTNSAIRQPWTRTLFSSVPSSVSDRFRQSSGGLQMYTFLL